MKPKIMGYKGSTNFEVGFIFAPYIPGGPVWLVARNWIDKEFKKLNKNGGYKLIIEHTARKGYYYPEHD